VTPEEVALVPSTSAGLALVAEGLDVRAGDNVVLAEGDFPANTYPWLNLRRKGVHTRLIPPRPGKSISLDDVRPHLDGHTRLVALSSAHFVTGAPLDIDEVGGYLGSEGILFCVDAIQSLGAFPCPGRHVDFMVADGHKWLLGPSGIGVLVVRRRVFNRLRPVLVGWKSVLEPENYHDPYPSLADTARRYEPGTLNNVGVVGLAAALALLREVGIDNIAAHLTSLRSALLRGLTRLGYQIVSPWDTALPTGITSFKHPKGDARRIYDRLTQAGCVVSLRNDPRGEPCVRVSPHFYNTPEQVFRFLTLLGTSDSK
jgi:selenocysteine lyase/cysteine desulfurase